MFGFNSSVWCAAMRSEVSLCGVQVCPCSASFLPVGCIKIKALIAHSRLPSLFPAVFVSTKQGCCHRFLSHEHFTCWERPFTAEWTQAVILPNTSIICLTLYGPAASQTEAAGQNQPSDGSSSSLPVCQKSSGGKTRSLLFSPTSSVFNSVSLCSHCSNLQKPN